MLCKVQQSSKQANQRREELKDRRMIVSCSLRHCFLLYEHGMAFLSFSTIESDHASLQEVKVSLIFCFTVFLCLRLGQFIKGYCQPNRQRVRISKNASFVYLCCLLSGTLFVRKLFLHNVLQKIFSKWKPYIVFKS